MGDIVFADRHWFSGTCAQAEVQLPVQLEQPTVHGGLPRVRFDHASPAAGTVNVFILPPGQPTTDATATFGTFAPNGRRTGYLLPGSYDVTVVRASNPSVTLAGPERISVEVGGLYTLALTDSAGGGEPILLVRQDDLAP
jgi:hypothetical protein